MAKLVLMERGEKYGRWTFLGPIEPPRSKRKGLFLCSCGNAKWIGVYEARYGKTMSCGCIQKQRPANYKHGGTGTAEYRCWEGMKSRCLDPGNQSFHNYGGRGITVSKSWKADFSKFLSDIGPKPAGRYYLDRIDPDGNYEKGNVRWADFETHQRNKRNAIRLSVNGVTDFLPAWAKISGNKAHTIWYRLKRGWPNEAAIFRGTQDGSKAPVFRSGTRLQNSI